MMSRACVWGYGCGPCQRCAEVTRESVLDLRTVVYKLAVLGKRVSRLLEPSAAVTVEREHIVFVSS